MTQPINLNTEKSSYYNVPKELHEQKIFIVWKKGPIKPNGKFDKIPIHPKGGWHASYKNSEIRIYLSDALIALKKVPEAHGIGIVIPEEKITANGSTGYLVAGDYDGANGDDANARKLLSRDLPHFKGCYLERSPSGFGFRTLMLSKFKPRSGSYGGGFELYSSGSWVTVTGEAARGKLKDRTFALTALIGELKAHQLTKPAEGFEAKKLNSNLAKLTMQVPHSTALESKLLKALEIIGAKESNEDWAITCWSVLSTGWDCAPDILHRWSQTAPDLYDERALNREIELFDPSRGVTLGTLFYKAKQIDPSFDASFATKPDERPRTQTQTNWLMTVGELLSKEPPPWLVDGLIPAVGVGAIFGPTGCGKTFLGLHLSFTVAIGLPFFGLECRPRPIVYCALEGQSGMQKRYLAAAKEAGASPLNFRVVSDGLNLALPETVNRLIEHVRETFGSSCLIFIDTLNQTIPGADENSSTDMSNVISSVNRISRELDSFVMLVHHSGKHADKGLRGHSSLAAAMDVIIKVANGAAGREWVIEKNKDGEANPHGAFELVSHEVEVGPSKKREVSCAVKPVFRLPTVQPKGPTGKHQKVLYPLIEKHGASATIDQLVDAYASHLKCAPNRQKPNARDAILGMLGSGHLIESSRGVCIPKNLSTRSETPIS